MNRKRNEFYIEKIEVERKNKKAYKMFVGVIYYLGKIKMRGNYAKRKTIIRLSSRYEGI